MSGFNEYTINLVSGIVDDLTSKYAISETSKMFTAPITGPRIFSLQAIWDSLAGTVDGTLELYMSNNGIDFNAVADSIYTLSGINGNNMWIKNVWNAPFIGVKFTKNNISTGNVKLLLSVKLL